jgi:hypothetical protein
VTYALTGSAAEKNCEGCQFTMDVGHYLVSEGLFDELGEPRVDSEGTPIATQEACRTPDLPIDGETWRIGYRESPPGLLLDYNDSGTWLEWYAAERLRGNVDFTWTATVGFTPLQDN